MVVHNPIIFNIDDGVEASIFSGKKVVCLDEPAIVRLHEHRLCVKRRTEDKTIYDYHIKQVDFIVSAGAQHVEIMSMDLAVPSLKLAGTSATAPTKLEELIARLRVLKSKYFPNTRQQQITDQSGLQDLQKARAERKAPMNILFLAIFPINRFEESMQDTYNHLLQETDRHYPYGGFVRTYQSLCNLYKQPPCASLLLTADVKWNSEMVREISLKDIKSPDALMPIIAALEMNSWFETLCVGGVKLSSELCNIFCRLAGRNQTLKRIEMTECSVSKEFFSVFAEALLSNESSKLDEFDFSGTFIDDRGIQQLAKFISHRKDTVYKLKLAGSQLSKKSSALLLNSLRNCAATLRELDISRNQLALDSVLALCEFLAGPNNLQLLNLEGCGIEKLETIFGALSRGCLRYMTCLTLAGNSFEPEAGHVPSSFDTFFRSCQSLRLCDLSQTNLSQSYLAHLFGCLGVNIETHNLELSLRSNNFGQESAVLFKNLFADVAAISALDLSSNNFGGLDGLQILIEALSNSKHLRSLRLQNIPLLASSGSLTSELKGLLCIPQLSSLSLADNRLGKGLLPFYQSLSNNHQLKQLNLSGNEIVDADIYDLSKVLMKSSGPRLSDIDLSRNKITLDGWQSLAIAVERNYHLMSLQIPPKDLAHFYKSQPETADRIVSTLSGYLFRNRLTAAKVSNQTSPGINGQDDFSQLTASQTLVHLNRSKPKLPGRSATKSNNSLADADRPVSPIPPAPAQPPKSTTSHRLSMVATPLAMDPSGTAHSPPVGPRRRSNKQNAEQSSPVEEVGPPEQRDYRDQLARILTVHRPVSVVIDKSPGGGNGNERPPSRKQTTETEKTNLTLPVAMPRGASLQDFSAISSPANSAPASPTGESSPLAEHANRKSTDNSSIMTTTNNLTRSPSRRTRPNSMALGHMGTLRRVTKLFDDDWKAKRAQWIKTKAEAVGVSGVDITGETFNDWIKNGVSLLEFVEALLKPLGTKEFPKYRKSSQLMIAHKLDNFNLLMAHLTDAHGFVGEVNGEDLLNAVPKKLEILFEALEHKCPTPVKEEVSISKSPTVSKSPTKEFSPVKESPLKESFKEEVAIEITVEEDVKVNEDVKEEEVKDVNEDHENVSEETKGEQ